MRDAMIGAIMEAAIHEVVTTIGVVIITGGMIVLITAAFTIVAIMEGITVDIVIVDTIVRGVTKESHWQTIPVPKETGIFCIH